MEFARFSKYFNWFIAKRIATESWLDEVDKVFPGVFDPIMEHDYQDIFMKLFAEVMGDTDGRLEYFFYERDGKWFDIEVEWNGEKYSVAIDSEKKLYELIMGTISYEDSQKID